MRSGSAISPAIRGWWLAATVAALPVGVAGQTPLEEAVETARLAWLRHDPTDLLAASDTVRLQLPEVGRAAAMHPMAAARVLGEYLESATEVEVELRRLRPSAEDHVYAELTRSYVVKGTTDMRVETVFLGFRLIEGEWRIREVRVLP